MTFLDVDDLAEGTVLQADVGVVGAGFAGIQLARDLGRAGLSVLLLESGRMEFDPRVQELARFEDVGKPLRKPDPDGPHHRYLRPELRGELRIRQFGGTSNTWTGKWRRFDPLDFEQRQWIPWSGWPITFDELRPYYEAVERELGLGDPVEFRRGDIVRRLRAHTDPSELAVSYHYWQKEPLRLRHPSAHGLDGSTSVTTVLGATATEIVLAENGSRVTSITFRSLDGRAFECRARDFVLAVGGLEAPRLLLASDRQSVAGIGNDNGLVGRFYMDHPRHKRGALRPGAVLQQPHRTGITGPRPRFKVGFSLTDDVQRREQLLNHVVYFRPVRGRRGGLARDALDRLQRSWAARRPARGEPAVAAPSPAGDGATRSTLRRREATVSDYAVSLYFEQAPNRDSRICTAREKDALGVPKLVVDWRLSATDEDSYERTHRLLTRAFRHSGLGELDFGPALPTLDDATDAAHHMGTTRMASSPTSGVVDADCRVFGTDNLFVASASVFPTGHSIGPTLTILALTKRLATHLRTRR